MATVKAVKTCVYCVSELSRRKHKYCNENCKLDYWFPKCTIDGCNNHSEISVPVHQRELGDNEAYRYRCEEHLVYEVAGCDRKSGSVDPTGWENDNRYYCKKHYYEKIAL